MAKQYSAVFTSVLYFAVVVYTSSPGHGQPLSCDQLNYLKQQKEEAYEDAETELASMMEKQTCLQGLRNSFKGDPPQLPEETADVFVACTDDGVKPTLEDAEDAVKDMQTLIEHKLDKVGDLLLEYEAVKQHYNDGCA